MHKLNVINAKIVIFNVNAYTFIKMPICLYNCKSDLMTPNSVTIGL